MFKWSLWLNTYFHLNTPPPKKNWLKLSQNDLQVGLPNICFMFKLFSFLIYEFSFFNNQFILSYEGNSRYRKNIHKFLYMRTILGNFMTEWEKLFMWYVSSFRTSSALSEFYVDVTTYTQEEQRETEISTYGIF